MAIFFAHKAQVDHAIQMDDAATWRELSVNVGRQNLADSTQKPEWILGQSVAAVTGSEKQFSGLSGSPRVTEGLVYIVRSSEDFVKFPKGAVLDARTTNPTWTPLFYSSVAVVTESGGPLSHGAVTAREMRIPAVMSVRECLGQLQNGHNGFA